VSIRREPSRVPKGRVAPQNARVRRPLASIPALAVVLSFGALLSSCYFTRSPSRPLPALAFRNPRLSEPRCLVVFLPGFLDTPDSYRDNDFPRDLVASGAGCDAVGVDLHFRYYGSVGVADMVYEDVLQPAIARGYDEIWLVGISMGGMGTLLTASQYAEHIDGIVLIAPFVGEEHVLREIEAAGGARSWTPPEGLAARPWSQDNYTQKIWSWLRGYHTDPENRPPLYIGWGADDRLGAADRLLADLMPEDHVVSMPGGHNWVTWRPIWRRLLEIVPMGPRPSEAR
jgi:pimeloyl-ACP methyl ester carboxylesterase